MRLAIPKAVIACVAAPLVFLQDVVSISCATSATVMTVASAADVQKLAAALECTGGGVFDVTWIGSIVIGDIIEVSGGSNLTVVGSGSPTSALNTESAGKNGAAVIDGGEISGIFNVSGPSTLNLYNLVLQGGNSTYGGAITGDFFISPNVSGGVTITAIDCSFLNNYASVKGGENNRMT